jgi:hypothetical protein
LVNAIGSVSKNKIKREAINARKCKKKKLSWSLRSHSKYLKMRKLSFTLH